MAGVLCSMVGASFVTAQAEVIRSKKSIVAFGNAQVDTAQSQFGGASALFDGSGDYLRIQTTSDLQLTSSGTWTIECWARFASVASSGNHHVLANYTFGGSFPGYGISVGVGTNGNLAFWDGNAWTNFGTVVTNTWYHIAVVNEGGSGKGYLNGSQVFTRTINSNIANTVTDLFIGSRTDTNGSLNGHIDELRISKSARYTANFTPATTPFVNDANTLLLLHMDGTDATTYFEDDNGVRAKKGIAAVGNAQVDTAQSKFGGSSAYFDTSLDWLTIDNTEDMRFGTNDFTIEFWFRPESRATNFATILQNRQYGSGAIQFTDRHNYNTSKLQVWVVNYQGADPMFLSTTNISNGTWYHVALTRSGNSWRFFLNGTQEGSTVTYSGDATAGISDYWGIGNDRVNTSVTQYNGWVDEVRVSNSARYTANFTPATTPFVNDSNTLLLLHMDGTDASTYFEDDNGVRAKIGLIQNSSTAVISTTQSKFGGTSLAGGRIAYARPWSIASGSDFTFEAWVYQTGRDNIPTVFADNISFYINNGNPGFFSGSQRNGSIQISLNTWNHVAWVRSSGTLTVWVNGQNAGSWANSTTMQSATALSYGIGGYPNDSSNNFVSGFLDELRISNSARYTATFTPPTTPFQNDANTLLLLHCDGTNNSTVFFDDNGVTPTHQYS